MRKCKIGIVGFGTVGSGIYKILGSEVDSHPILKEIEIVKIDKKFIEDTGLKASLTPSRSNGFLNILLKMQSQANEFL